jgi:hypothetical protein
MSISAALAGGFVGTLGLSTALRGANELGLARVDLPSLLGTAITGDRTRAKTLGYLLHLAAGGLRAHLLGGPLGDRHDRVAGRGAVRSDCCTESSPPPRS